MPDGMPSPWAHPVILSLATGEGFTWCYEEGAYVG